MFEEILRCARILVHAADAHAACECALCKAGDEQQQCELFWIRTTAARQLEAAHL